jgi:hypothetical protein
MPLASNVLDGRPVQKDAAGGEPRTEGRQDDAVAVREAPALVPGQLRYAGRGTNSSRFPWVPSAEKAQLAQPVRSLVDRPALGALASSCVSDSRNLILGDEPS